MDCDNLIFIDESRINIGMTRLYGRAFGEERVIDYVSDVRFERLSIISSMRLDGTLVPMTFKGTLNGDVFNTYIKQCLIPTLRKGDIAIMDKVMS